MQGRLCLANLKAFNESSMDGLTVGNVTYCSRLSTLHPIQPCRQAGGVHTGKCTVKGMENGRS